MPLYPGHIDVIAVGKLQSKAWRSAEQDYVKRLGHYVNFDLKEVKDAVGREHPDRVAMQREGERLLHAATGASHLVALTPDGQMTHSPGLARYLQKRLEVYGRIAFLIGGPLGLSPELLAASNDQISLSPLTFTHEMARVILLEQLYRAFTILNNEKYHK